jgi:hypothetical protein
MEFSGKVNLSYKCKIIHLKPIDYESLQNGNSDIEQFTAFLMQ